MNSLAPTIPKGFDPKQAHVVAQWKADHPLVSCRFDPAGRYVFCGVEGSTVERFNLADGKRVSFPGGHESWVFALAFSKDGSTMISGGGDGRLVAWEANADRPKPLRTTEAHSGWIRALGTSPDGKLLASGANDRLVKIWDLATGKQVHALAGHKGHVYSLEFHPDGKTLLSGDLQGELAIWDLASGKRAGTLDARPLHTYEGGQQVDFGGVRSIAIPPDGRFIAAGGLYKASNPLGAVHEPLVLLYDGKTQKKVRDLLTDNITGGVIWRIRFLADGTLLGGCGGSNGGLLLFWKTDANKDQHRLALPNILRDLDLHPDGLRVASAHHDRHVRITRLAAKTA